MASLLLSAGAAIARRHPNKPINLMVPYPAGGPSDALACKYAVRQRCPSITPGRWRAEFEQDGFKDAVTHLMLKCTAIHQSKLDKRTAT